MQRFIFPTLLLLTFLTFPFRSVQAQLSSTEVDALMEDALTKFKVAGAAIAIVKDGKIIHEKGYGLREIGGKQKVDEHTNFQIASNSKAFTCTALAIWWKRVSWTGKTKCSSISPNSKCIMNM
mgnify:CR=1 FL=1